MKRVIFYCFTIGFVCCWLFGSAATSFANDLQFDTAFTIRADAAPPNGTAEEIYTGASGLCRDDTICGSIQNSTQYDEFFLEFPLGNLLQAVGSARFYLFFSESFPDPSMGDSIDLNLAVYEGDGVPDINKFGITGDPLDPITITNIAQNLYSVDVTSVVNDFIEGEVSHLGIRLYLSNASEAGRSPYLKFGDGILSICATTTTTDLQDTMYPTGAVHAQPILKWHPFYKWLKIKLDGYVLDELSAAKDGGGNGVSWAYLDIKGKKIVLLGEDRKGQPVNLLDDTGGFNVVTYLKPDKSGVYEIKLYAADTNAEAPNFGLVDSTSVYLPYRTPTKDKDEDKIRK